MKPPGEARPEVLALSGAGRWPLSVSNASGQLLVPKEARSIDLLAMDNRRLSVEMDPKSAQPTIAVFDPPIAVQGAVVHYEDGIAIGIPEALVWCDHVPGVWVHSDDSGQFTLPHVPLDPSENYPSVRLAAAASGYEGQVFPLAAGPESSSIRSQLLALELLLFKAPESGQYHGRVLDSSGREIEGASVFLVPADAPDEMVRVLAGVGGQPTRGATATTDALGKFSINSRDSGYWDLVVVQGAKRPMIVAGLPALEAGESRDLGELLLLDPWMQAGTVMDSENQPLGGVRVDRFFRYRLPNWSDSVADTTGGSTQTEEDGRFSVPMRVPDGLNRGVDLRFTKDGYESSWLRNVVRPMSPEPEMVLNRLETIEGEVISEDEDPIAGARLYRDSGIEADSHHQGARASSLTVTDEAGKFEINQWPPGQAWLRIEAEGFAIQRRRIEPSTENSREITVRLAPEVLIRGMVLRPSGEPVEHATVRAGSAIVETGTGGTFELEGLGPGSYAIHASHPQVGQDLTHVELTSGQRTFQVEFILRDELELRGRVLYEDGDPVEMASVFASDPFGEKSTDFTDTNGSFRFLDLEPGRYELTAAGSGYGTLEPISAEVGTASGGRSVTLVVVARGSVEGSIRGSSEPPGQLEISWSCSDGSTKRGRVFPDYTFRIDGVRPAECWAVARSLESEQLASRRVRLSPEHPSATVELEFETEGHVEGKVSLQGNPLDGVPVGLWAGDGIKVGQALTNSTGSFRLIGIPDGNYTLSVELDGAPVFFNTPIDVPNSSIDWDLETGAVELVVQGTAGSSVHSARAVAKPRGELTGRPPRPAVCIQEICRWNHLAPGRYEVRVGAMGHKSQEVEATVLGRKDIYISVQLKKLE